VREAEAWVNGIANRGKEGVSTLTKIMVVGIFMIAIAALVGVRVTGFCGKDSRPKVARAQIMNFVTALAAYRLDNKRYPTTEQGLDALIHQPTREPVPLNYPKGGYLSGKEIPLDPWSNPYVYFSPGLKGKEYAIISYGANGVEGGKGNNADINSGNLEKER
jgi:general secretion pathway protein G